MAYAIRFLSCFVVFCKVSFLRFMIFYTLVRFFDKIAFLTNFYIWDETRILEFLFLITPKCAVINCDYTLQQSDLIYNLKTNPQ